MLNYPTRSKSQLNIINEDNTGSFNMKLFIAVLTSICNIGFTGARNKPFVAHSILKIKSFYDSILIIL